MRHSTSFPNGRRARKPSLAPCPSIRHAVAETSRRPVSLFDVRSNQYPSRIFTTGKQTVQSLDNDPTCRLANGALIVGDACSTRTFEVGDLLHASNWTVAQSVGIELTRRRDVSTFPSHSP